MRNISVVGDKMIEDVIETWLVLRSEIKFFIMATWKPFLIVSSVL